MSFVEVAARIGWLARGALYTLLAVLVAGIPAGANDEKADKQGAFEALANTSHGTWLLGALCAGMVGFAGFRLWAAATGSREKTSRRVGWVVSATVYLFFAYAAADVLRGAGSEDNQEKALAARVLTWSWGHLVVAGVALLMLAVAANYVRKGVKERFLRDIDESAVPDPLHGPVRVLGVAGWLGRALVWSLVAFFLLRAAIQHDPNEPVGLDESLHALLGQSWGVALLWVAFAGMIAYALLCGATAAWPDPEPDS